MKVFVALLAAILVSGAAAQFEVSVEPAVVGRGEEYLHADRLHVIIWIAHQNYFGLQDEDDCWMNIEE